VDVEAGIMESGERLDECRSLLPLRQGAYPHEALSFQRKTGSAIHPQMIEV